MTELFEGQCQCGEIKYRVTGESLALFACHCSECQRQSSSAFGMALWVTTSTVEIVSGHLKTWVRSTPNGEEMACQFCPTCGARIFHRIKGREVILSIKPGTLNNTKWLRPVGHIWTGNAQPWFELGDECLVYSGNPPDGFVEILQCWEKVKPCI